MPQERQLKRSAPILARIRQLSSCFKSAQGALSTPVGSLHSLRNLHRLARRGLYCSEMRSRRWRKPCLPLYSAVYSAMPQYSNREIQLFLHPSRIFFPKADSQLSTSCLYPICSNSTHVHSQWLPESGTGWHWILRATKPRRNLRLYEWWLILLNS